MKPDGFVDPLTATYDALWATGRQALSTGCVDPEPLPAEPTVRWGISAVLRPRPWPHALATCATACAGLLGPSGLMYGEDAFHVTLRAIEGYREHITDHDESVRAYRDALATISRRMPPIRLRLRGLTATAGGILVQGWPAAELQRFRHALYERLATVGLAARGPETSQDTIRTTAHATLAIFEGPVARPTGLIDLIEVHRTTHFGDWVFAELSLVGYRRTAGHVSLIEYGRFAFDTADAREVAQ